MKDKQDHTVTSLAKSIIKTSSQFELDSIGGKETHNDYWIRHHVIQKTLERDSLIFMEGMRDKDQPKFMSVREFKEEKANRDQWENFSSGDFKEDFVDKFESKDDRELNNPGIFERNHYFERIFPGLNIQKPGYDLYGTTTSILGLIALYICMNYERYSFT